MRNASPSTWNVCAQPPCFHVSRDDFGFLREREACLIIKVVAPPGWTRQHYRGLEPGCDDVSLTTISNWTWLEAGIDCSLRAT